MIIRYFLLIMEISRQTSPLRNSDMQTMMYVEVPLDTGFIIGSDHDTVCAGVVGTAIRNSTSCAGRRAAA